MDLLENDEQQQLADMFARVATEMFPLEQDIKRASDARWQAVAELGWLGIMTPESSGGSGLSVVEAILLFRESGRQLIPGPLLGCVLAARMATAASEADLAAAIVQGTTRVALLEPGDAGSDTPVRIIDGEDAELGLLVIPEEARLYALPQERTRRLCIDPASSLELGALASEPKLTVPRDVAPIFLEANLLLAAMAAGMCEATRDESSAYAKLREQFGRPIGTFQAVSHRCADMAARADVAWLQVVMAALTLQADEADAEFAVISARLVSVSNAIANAADNIQNHGGMGFTEELPPHRYAKRAALFDKLLGGRRAAQERVLAVPAAIVQGELRAA